MRLKVHKWIILGEIMESEKSAERWRKVVLPTYSIIRRTHREIAYHYHNQGSESGQKGSQT